MDEALKQIGERLKGLRESLDVSVQEMAETCGVTEEKYLKMEGGESDLAVSRLYKLSRKGALWGLQNCQNALLREGAGLECAFA